jgi:hypothetical protein
MLKKSISDSVVNRLHEELWEKAEKTYKKPNLVPRDVAQNISDHTRALYVLQVWQKEGSKGSPIRYMASYSIPEDVIAEVANEYCGVVVEEGEIAEELRPSKRADKWDAFLKWAKDKVFEQYTTEQLVEVSGFSYQTTLKFVSENPTFRKVKRGLWEVRDPKADREAEKS